MIEAGNHIYSQDSPEQVAAAAAGGPASANPADWTLPTPIYGGYGGQLVFFETMTPMVRTTFVFIESVERREERKEDGSLTTSTNHHPK